jgi:hypothetical protein
MREAAGRTAILRPMATADLTVVGLGRSVEERLEE